MNYRIEKKDRIDIIAKKKNFSNDVEQNNEQLPKYWDDCRKDNTIDSLYKYAAEYGVFGGALIGVCAEDTKKNEVTWAIFESIGPMPTAFQDLLHKVYSEFFPTSEYHPCGSLDIQVYPNGDMQSPSYKCELWIPVGKN